MGRGITCSILVLPCVRHYYNTDLPSCFVSSADTPQSLLYKCKVFIRRLLSCHLENARELPIPVSLKQFLMQEAY